MDTVEVCNIRVYNTATRLIFEHRRVPMEHVRLLVGHPTLEVEILSTYRISRDELTSSSSF